MTYSLRASATVGLLVSCLGAALAACGGNGTDAGDNGNTVTPGTPGGSAGHKATGGSAGASGKGGSAGGTGGSHLAGGSAGATSTGGSGGASGKGGASGASGKGGSTGTAGSGGSSNGGSGGAKGGSSGSSAGGNAGSGGSAPNHGKTVSIFVTPGNSTINVTGGTSAPDQLQAIPVYEDATQGPPITDATWSIAPADRATVDATGLVTATNVVGGDVIVTATEGSLSATGTVHIKITDSVNGDGVSPGDMGSLDGASASDPGAQWIYPYDQTVFPQGIIAPVLMWNGYAAGDEMKVSIVSSSVDLEMYFKPSGPSITIPDAEWTKLTESGSAGTATVKVSRLSSGNATVVVNQTWKLASGSLRGSVYYWSNNLGRVLRIQPGMAAATPVNFLSMSPSGDPGGCTTCHAVSANGAVLTLGGGVASGDSGWSVFDLLGNQLTATGRTRAWAMLALTPDGKTAALNNAPLPGGPGEDGGLYDVASGNKLSGTGADTTLFDMPAFAPDGSKLVYVDHGSHDLMEMAFSDSGAPTLGPPNMMVTASGDPTYNAIAFPTVSPDGNTAVYHHGTLDTRLGNGDLWAAPVSAAGAETPLDALNGTNYPFFYGDRDRHLDYEPSFAPVAAGGYFWVVFTSRRTYGNVLTGPANCGGASGGCGTKQIWVAAFDQNPTPGQDPSHPAFWVPGQDPTSLNMRAFWALDPCKDDGVSCSASSQCCGGVCQANGTCGEPPGQTCKPVGSTCASASDCCGADQGYQCINSHCTEPKP